MLAYHNSQLQLAYELQYSSTPPKKNKGAFKQCGCALVAQNCIALSKSLNGLDFNEWEIEEVCSYSKFKKLANHVWDYSDLKNNEFIVSKITSERERVISERKNDEMVQKMQNFDCEETLSHIYDSFKKFLNHHEAGRWECPQLFRYSSRDTILRKVLQLCNVLQTNYLKNSSGIASATLLGAKGIGKTYTLSTIARMIPIFFNNTISIYYDYTNQRLAFPSELLIAALRERGEQVAHNKNLDNLLQLLQNRQLKIFFIFDEIEELYKELAS